MTRASTPTLVSTPSDPAHDATPDVRSPMPRSYQFYIILALFDVGVIIAGIIVQHQTLDSFNQALEDINTAQQYHHWLNNLATNILHLNAPGNNVFTAKTLDEWDAQHASFLRAHAQFEAYHRDSPREARVPARYREQMNRMVDIEGRIFQNFHQVVSEGTLDPSERERLVTGSAGLMAAMDRAQAEAMQALLREMQILLVRQQRALDAHNLTLNSRTTLEFVFILIVTLILAGVTWYWRQLQRIHESFVRERSRANQERRQRLASVGEVCSSVAHGIRNPVAAISSSAQLVLEYGQVDDASRERIKDIVMVCRNLTQRVTQLLSFVRDESKGMMAIKPADLLLQAAGEIEHELNRRRVTVIQDFQDATVMIKGDPHLITQALIEMLSNAMDAMQNGGTVRLVCRRSADDPDRVEFGVIDDGPGMSEDVKKRACELFFTRKHGGHGVGLFSIRRTAELNNALLIINDARPSGVDIRFSAYVHDPSPP